MPDPKITAARMRRHVDRHLLTHQVQRPTGNVSRLVDAILLALATELESRADQEPTTRPNGQGIEARLRADPDWKRSGRGR